MPASRAVFFDRDGVLNVDTNYPYLPQHIQWIPGAFEAVKAANDAGFRAFVITNQAGVARGFYTEEHVRALHEWMKREFASHGAVIEDFAYCPHHPTAGQGAYLTDCACRKPKPGMIEGLISRHGLTAQGSLVIGDKESDMGAAQAASMKGYLFPGGNLADFVKKILSEAGG